MKVRLPAWVAGLLLLSIAGAAIPAGAANPGETPLKTTPTPTPSVTAAISPDLVPEEDIIRYGEGYRFDHDGWIFLHIEGEPYQRGFQHGLLLAPELAEVSRYLNHLVFLDTGKRWQFFIHQAENLYADKLGEELLDEIKGIADGAREAGVDVEWGEILAWNASIELLDYWWPNAGLDEDRMAGRFATRQAGCSAFIATGSATRDGKVVMAHNTWDDYTTGGSFDNLLLDIQPAEGYRIFMQSVPGYIFSSSDFFVTGAGLMGTETTISTFQKYDPNGTPEFVRVRNAMQYGDDLDDFLRIMRDGNNGGYANSWLLADVDSGEIVRFEQGLEYENVDRTRDGYFVGFNAPEDVRIRNLECSDTGYSDIRRHTGARRVRLRQLMEDNLGKIDVEKAKEILADHYDVFLQKPDHPSSRTVDGHYELDSHLYGDLPGKTTPYVPKGTVDGKVMDSDLARDYSFWARWGNSSGMPFVAEQYLTEHPQYDFLEGYLQDRPARPWALFSVEAAKPHIDDGAEVARYPLLGKWQSTDDGEVEAFFEFRDNRVLVVEIAGKVNKTRYELVDDDTFLMADEAQEPVSIDYVVEGDRLHMTIRGTTVVFRRVTQ